MRMEGQDESSNVEDVRGSGFRPVHGISLGSIVLALIVGWIFHINPLALLGLVNSGPDVNSVPTSGVSSTSPAGDAQARFASQILRSTEVVWGDVFAQMNRTYEEPKLVLFRGAYPTACGMGRTAAGPFYCPNDHRVYLDLSFFDLMTEQLGAPGQFAHAYVIGHEVGHHVQNLLGILGEGGGGREAGATGHNVRIELQADCFAGVWANLSQQENGWRLEPGDVESALNAASKIGDDTLQRRSQGTVVPESFTHGTSAQRVNWFERGFNAGRIQACDTLNARQL
jgi:uncharacterized protein